MGAAASTHANRVVQAKRRAGTMAKAVRARLSKASSVSSSSSTEQLEAKAGEEEVVNLAWEREQALFELIPYCGLPGTMRLLENVFESLPDSFLPGERATVRWDGPNGHSAGDHEARRLLDARSEDGDTLLLSAAKNGMEHACLLLLRKGADVHTTSKEGAATLHYACGEGTASVTVASELLRRGASVGAIEFVTGRTPLHYAACARAGDGGATARALVDLLLRAGADVNGRDNDGYTAEAYAQQAGLEHVAAMLAASARRRRRRGGDAHETQAGGKGGSGSSGQNDYYYTDEDDAYAGGRHERSLSEVPLHPGRRPRSMDQVQGLSALNEAGADDGETGGTSTDGHDETAAGAGDNELEERLQVSAPSPTYYGSGTSPDHASRPSTSTSPSTSPSRRHAAEGADAIAVSPTYYGSGASPEARGKRRDNTLWGSFQFQASPSSTTSGTPHQHQRSSPLRRRRLDSGQSTATAVYHGDGEDSAAYSPGPNEGLLHDDSTFGSQSQSQSQSPSRQRQGHMRQSSEPPHPPSEELGAAPQFAEAEYYAEAADAEVPATTEYAAGGHDEVPGGTEPSHTMQNTASELAIVTTMAYEADYAQQEQPQQQEPLAITPTGTARWPATFGQDDSGTGGEAVYAEGASEMNTWAGAEVAAAAATVEEEEAAESGAPAGRGLAEASEYYPEAVADAQAMSEPAAAAAAAAAAEEGGAAFEAASAETTYEEAAGAGDAEQTAPAPVAAPVMVLAPAPAPAVASNVTPPGAALGAGTSALATQVSQSGLGHSLALKHSPVAAETRTEDLSDEATAMLKREGLDSLLVDAQAQRDKKKGIAGDVDEPFSSPRWADLRVQSRAKVFATPHGYMQTQRRAFVAGARACARRCRSSLETWRDKAKKAKKQRTATLMQLAVEASQRTGLEKKLGAAKSQLAAVTEEKLHVATEADRERQQAAEKLADVTRRLQLAEERADAVAAKLAVREQQEAEAAAARKAADAARQAEADALVVELRESLAAARDGDAEAQAATDQALAALRLRETEAASLKKQVRALEQQGNELRRQLTEAAGRLATGRHDCDRLKARVSVLEQAGAAGQAALEQARGEAAAVARTAAAATADQVRQAAERQEGLARQLRAAQVEFRREQSVRRKYERELSRLRGKVRVVCRIRPLFKGELACDPSLALAVSGASRTSAASAAKRADAAAADGIALDQSGAVDGCSVRLRYKGTAHVFEFDRVFAPDATQATVFAECSDLVDLVTRGYNVCIFAYGQTGSGKTYTMLGDPAAVGALQGGTAAATASGEDASPWSSALLGIGPRAIRQIFRGIGKGAGGSSSSSSRKPKKPQVPPTPPVGGSFAFDQAEASGDSKAKAPAYEVTTSLFEIYRGKLNDLLLHAPSNGGGAGGGGGQQEKPRLLVKCDAAGKVTVEGATIQTASSMEDLQSVLALGMANRRTSATGMNAQSSRSHLVQRVHVRVTDRATKVTTHGTLTLVDLAGSERVARTGASGETLKEAQSINRSLSALGNVVSALTSGAAHTPYRDSLLTQLMRDSLGGNAKTLLVANIAPGALDASEAFSSLCFARRCKQVVNRASALVATKQLLQLKKQLKNLRAKAGAKG